MLEKFRQIESDVDLVDIVLSQMQQEDPLLAEGLVGPHSSDAEDILAYKIGSAIAYSYLCSLAVAYSPRTPENVEEHIMERNEIMLNSGLQDLDTIETNHLLIKCIGELNRNFALGVEGYINQSGKTPEQAYPFLLGVYDVAGMMLRPLPTSEVA